MTTEELAEKLADLCRRAMDDGLDVEDIQSELQIASDNLEED